MVQPRAVRYRLSDREPVESLLSTKEANFCITAIGGFCPRRSTRIRLAMAAFELENSTVKEERSVRR